MKKIIQNKKQTIELTEIEIKKIKFQLNKTRELFDDISHCCKLLSTTPKTLKQLVLKSQITFNQICKNIKEMITKK